VNHPPAPLPPETHERLRRDFWHWAIRAVLDLAAREAAEQEQQLPDGQRAPASDEAA
jgi:hypothetical protein